MKKTGERIPRSITAHSGPILFGLPWRDHSRRLDGLVVRRDLHPVAAARGTHAGFSLNGIVCFVPPPPAKISYWRTPLFTRTLRIPEVPFTVVGRNVIPGICHVGSTTDISSCSAGGIATDT